MAQTLPTTTRLAPWSRRSRTSPLERTPPPVCTNWPALASKLEQRRFVGPFAVARGLEVNNVQPLGALVHVFGGHISRLTVVVGHFIEIAVQQAHAATVKEIDGRYQLHDSSRKFFSTWAPARAERSG